MKAYRFYISKPPYKIFNIIWIIKGGSNEVLRDYVIKYLKNLKIINYETNT